MNTRRPPDAATIRELAVRADVDPRTIVKELKGERARGMAGRRAREALVAAGLVQDACVSEDAVAPNVPTG